jgi:DNA-binding transcriptional LysR family regulator
MPGIQSNLLEMDVLRSFVAISETGSFTAAARTVSRTPSAVSMQIKKLEEQVGRPLFNREGRTVSLTADGEALLGVGQQMLRLNEQAMTRFYGDAVQGEVRFGAPDDFGTRFLPNILSRFATTHPGVEVNVSLNTSSYLTEQLEDEEIDLTLVTTVNRDRGRAVGRLVFSEPLIWVGVKRGTVKDDDVLPLALAGKDCAWRGMALDALDKVGRDYRIAYTSENCHGQLAALLADLAIAPLPKSLLTSGFERLDKKHGLPPLENYEMRLLERPGAGPASKAFAEHVIESFADLAR